MISGLLLFFKFIFDNRNYLIYLFFSVFTFYVVNLKHLNDSYRNKIEILNKRIKIQEDLKKINDDKKNSSDESFKIFKNKIEKIQNDEIFLKDNNLEKYFKNLNELIKLYKYDVN